MLGVHIAGRKTHPDAQVRQLTKAGCKKVFREVASGAKTDRAQLRRNPLAAKAAARTSQELTYMVVTAKEAAGPAETPCATHPHGDVPPRALVAAGATANRVRHGTVPDLAAVAVLAGGANGQTVSREIAG